jgi:hypothetical protein
MFLAVLLRAAFEDVLAVGKSVLRIAQHELFRRHDEVAIGGSNPRVRDHRQRVDLDRDLPRRLAGRFLTHSHHDRNRLPLKMHLALCQKRLVRHDAADLVLAEKVYRSDDPEHAVARFGFSSINVSQRAVGNRGIENTRVQCP